MEAKVVWNGKLNFTGSADGSGWSIPLQAAEPEGDGQGVRPMELLAIGLAGCTAMDVVSILEKKRQQVTAFEVKVHADRADDHPRVFTKIVVEYMVTGKDIDPAAVERAIELSETKYCSAQAMLRKAAPIESRYTIIPV